MKKMLLMIILFLVPLVTLADDDLAPNSKSAVLREYTTGKIIYEKNSQQKLPIASMTKVMSLLIIMEEIDEGRLKLNDQVLISDAASGMGGSQVFLQSGQKNKVKDLLKAITISSANDATVAMAEKIAGTETEFVKLMNKRAKKLGLKNTNFVNCHGLDDDNHYSTAEDMSVIANELIHHEEILKYTSIYDEYFVKEDGNKIWMVNTNKTRC